MTPTCGVCYEHESKYKCPICELRYCSITCYKEHKTSHGQNVVGADESGQHPLKDRPGTTQRVPKVEFTGFENDKDFQRLLVRYPLLKVQLQAIYALTLDPGPDDARSWNRTPLPGFQQHSRGQRGRGRGGRGRGNVGRGDRDAAVPPGRQRGAWTQAKGDKEALDVLKRLRGSQGDKETDEAAGLKEFIALCQMRFGSESSSS